MSELLGQILSIIKDHQQSIELSEGLITQLKSNLERNLDAPLGICSFKLDPPTTPKNVGTQMKLQMKVEPIKDKPKRVIDEKIYEALLPPVKAVVRSKDHTVEAASRLSDLVKYLADSFLSTVKKPAEKSDADILAFIKDHDADIASFIDNECRRNIIKCLAERVQAETPAPIVLKVPTEGSILKVKAVETIDTEFDQNITAEEVVQGGGKAKLMQNSQRALSPIQEGNISIKSSQPHVLKTLGIDYMPLDIELHNEDSPKTSNVKEVIPSKIVLKDLNIFQDPETEVKEAVGPAKKHIILPEVKLTEPDDVVPPGELVVALDEALMGLEEDIRELIYNKAVEPKVKNNFRRSSRTSIFRGNIMSQ